MSQPLDTLIIGAGTAGLAALREVRKRTDRYLIVNEGPWGTTCARVGCMPSKALIEAANAFHRRHAFEAFGLRGAQGGYGLAVPPDQVLLFQIVEAIDGPVLEPLPVDDGQGPEVKAVWRAVAGRIEQVLRETTLRRMVDMGGPMSMYFI